MKIALQKLTEKSAWIFFAAIVLLAGCGTNGPAYEPPVPQAAAVVDMGIHRYNPNSVEINAGDTVEWRNTSMATHTVTDDDDLAQNLNDAVLPLHAKPFNSGDIVPGDVYLHTFKAPGTYRYFCRYHEGDGMAGTVIVRARQ